LTLLDALVRIVLYAWDFRKKIRVVNQILDKVRPDVILTPMDSGIGFHSTLIIEARKRGVPTLVVPYAIWEPAALVFARKGRQDRSRKLNMQRAVNRLVARWYPAHVIRDENVELLVTRGEKVLAARLLGVLPPYPIRCYAGCGLAARVAVEGRRNWDICRQRGVPRDVLRITGRASSDVIHRLLQEATHQRGRLCDDLGLSINNRIVLLSVPPLAEQGFCTWPRQAREMDFLLGTLAALDSVSVVLSLHPSSRPEDYIELAKRHGAHLALDYSIEQLMPASDLFVSAFSSTTVMAMGCGVPAINADFYGMHYALFNTCPGVLTVREKGRLLPVLRRVLGDPAYYAQLVVEQKKSAAYWMTLDGRCSERLTAVIDELVAGGESVETRQAA
jgi:hypothetical protein